MSERLNILFNKQLQNSLSREERIELLGLFLEPSLQEQLQQLVAGAWSGTGEEESLSAEARGDVFRRILLEGAQEKPLPAEVVPLSKGRSARYWIAAASVLLLIGMVSYLFLKPSSEQASTPLVKNQIIVAPQKSSAHIRLSNGNIVYLDAPSNGQVALEPGTYVEKTASGEIVLRKATDAILSEAVYNTLTNPQGSQVVNMRLPDGTLLWLNAGSSVTYPVAFGSAARKVSVTGEVYFEVEKERRPFIVTTNRQTEVMVLGTHFNVNSYDNEKSQQITLLEGAVRVIKGKDSVVISPREQAVVLEKIRVQKHIDTEKTMAWKNGLFNFEGAGLEEVMRQLERWYNIEVVYEGAVPEFTFLGEISRDLTLNDLLIGLERSEVKFRIEGRKLIVMP